MISSAIVCPAAPLLIAGLASSLAEQVPELRADCEGMVAPLAAVDRIVVLAAGHTTAIRSDLLAGDGPGDLAGMARSVRGCGPPTAPGTAVARNLLRRAGIQLPAVAVELAGSPDPGIRPALESQLGPSEERVGLLVTADGSACHGQHAPGAADDRAQAYDAAIWAALAAGDPVALASAVADRELAAALLVSGAAPLAALARVTRGLGPPAVKAGYRGAPFGVGYFVVGWYFR